MKAQIVTTATLFAAFAAALPAADPQLLNLVMPDAKVLAGVNVEQAKGTPFGQYVLTQMQAQDQEMQKLATLTGFDPRRDVRELLVASNGVPADKTGLALASGTFDPAKITAAALLSGAKTETYNGVTIIEDPKQTNAIAFLSSTLVAAGDAASVKAAIDRQRTPQAIPSDLAVKVNQWSATQDAWVICSVPPSTLQPPATAPHVPGITGQGAFQSIQQASIGVKLGTLIVLTAEAQADTPQNASAMGDVLKLLANIMQMQAAQNPEAAALLKSLVVSTQGNTLKVSVSLPQDQLQQLVKPRKAEATKARKGERKM